MRNTMRNALYISVWDDGSEVTTQCYYDKENNTVSDIEVVDVLGLDILEDEYVMHDGVVIRDFETI